MFVLCRTSKHASLIVCKYSSTVLHQFADILDNHGSDNSGVILVCRKSLVKIFGKAWQIMQAIFRVLIIKM